MKTLSSEKRPNFQSLCFALYHICCGGGQYVMMSTCLWQLENAMAQHRDLLPSTEVDEPTPKRQKTSHDVPPYTPGHVSHTVSPAS